MGLSAVSKPEGSDRGALFGRIEARSTVWRRHVAALVSGSATGEGRALEEELRTLAREATAHDLPLLAEELSACRAIVQGALVLGRLEASPQKDLDDALDRVVRYAGEQRLLASPRGQRRARRGTMRIAAFGGQNLVDGLVAEDWAAEDEAPAFRVERVTQLPPGRRDAGKLPDVMVIDLAADGADQAVFAWLDDPATEAVPLVVLGTFESVEESAALVARGVSRILPKPVAPGALRRACVEVGGVRARPFEPIGETNVERLGLRLASELQRGLGDAVDAKIRKNTFDLEGGDEVLTVLWDAVARIRELVSARSKGAIRFAPAGPIDALPRACWLDGRRDKGRRALGPGEVREGGTGRLDGCRILVVEDDLSVNWFLAGVLQEAGAEVLSARHGREALEIAFRQPPDMVLTDVVMPELDGLSLRRALACDVRLRSIPVIMLSWKEDLLQRMRELGVEADGYLRKQASDREIVQRVLEVLRGRRAVAERLASEDAVRGRLDGLTACDLLAMVCALRPEARVTVRDARHTIEIDVRGGRPVVATRTDANGHSERGPTVIASLLGIGGGRFGVTSLDPGTPVSVELEGTLEEQLVEPVARVRAAQRLLAGASLLETDRVVLDEGRVESLLAATPEPARGVLTTLAAGISPRELVVGGRAAGELVERVLADAARQGAIVAVRQGGHDVLAPAVTREIAVQSGDREAARVSVALLAENVRGEALDDPSPEPGECERISSEDIGGLLTESTPAPQRRDHTPMFASVAVDEDAVRQHTPAWSVVAEREARLAELAPRKTTEDDARSRNRRDDDEDRDDRDDRDRDDRERRRDDREDRRARDRARDRDRRRDDRDDDYRDRRRDDDDQERRRDDREDRRARDEDRRRYDDDGPLLPRLPGPSAWATRTPEPPRKRNGFLWPAVFGVLGVGLAVGARYMREQQPAPPATIPVPVAAPVEPAPPAAPAPSAAASPAPVAVADEPKVLPLTDAEAAKLGKDEGILEVVAGQNDVIFVGGKERGHGPVVKVPLSAKDEPYEVRVKMRGEERVDYVVVKAGVRTRIRMAPPWSR